MTPADMADPLPAATGRDVVKEYNTDRPPVDSAGGTAAYRTSQGGNPLNLCRP